MEVIGGVKQVVEAAEVLITATTAREPIVKNKAWRQSERIGFSHQPTKTNFYCVVFHLGENAGMTP